MLRPGDTLSDEDRERISERILVQDQDAILLKPGLLADRSRATNILSSFFDQTITGVLPLILPNHIATLLNESISSLLPIASSRIREGRDRNQCWVLLGGLYGRFPVPEDQKADLRYLLLAERFGNDPMALLAACAVAEQMDCADAVPHLRTELLKLASHVSKGAVADRDKRFQQIVQAACQLMFALPLSERAQFITGLFVDLVTNYPAGAAILGPSIQHVCDLPHYYDNDDFWRLNLYLRSGPPRP